jgi:hypothetical protein
MGGVEDRRGWGGQGVGEHATFSVARSSAGFSLCPKIYLPAPIRLNVLKKTIEL